MSVFDQFKAIQGMMKNMTPDELRQMIAGAKESQKMLEEYIKRIVDEEIGKRGLVSRDEVRWMIKEKEQN